MSLYRWKMRPLIVFAPTSREPAFVRQMEMLDTGRQGIAARDMAIVTVTGEEVSAQIGPRPDLSAKALRRRYAVARGSFRVVLIGKDGGVKLSEDEAVGVGALFALIDSMPMRRQEMRERGR